MECDLSPGASDDQIDKILHKHQVEVARLAEAQEDEKKQQEEHFKVESGRLSVNILKFVAIFNIIRMSYMFGKYFYRQPIILFHVI